MEAVFGVKVRLKPDSHLGVRGMTEGLEGLRFLLGLEASGGSVRVVPQPTRNRHVWSSVPWHVMRTCGRHCDWLK